MEAKGIHDIAIKLKNNLNLNGEVFNFGPKSLKNLSVINVNKIMEKFWNKVEWKIERTKKDDHYETKLLQLNLKKLDQAVEQHLSPKKL